MKLDLFSVPIFIDNIDASKIILSNGKFEKTWISQTNSSFNSENKLDLESEKYLMEKIVHLLSDHFFKPVKLSLVNIWENRYNEGDFQEKHVHTHSHFSFIIYKKISESKTLFINPSNYLISSFFADNYVDNSNLFQLNFRPSCRENQIVLFPSFLEHAVSKTDGGVTISGNLIIRD